MFRPDKCNGEFYENCDSSRKYSGSQITSALQNAGQNDLLSYMQQNWVSNDESADDFWSHEVGELFFIQCMVSLTLFLARCSTTVGYSWDLVCALTARILRIC
jgi:hypothetical protein